MINKLLIVGCGLIGSSILKKVCKKKIAKKLFVFEKSKKNQRILKRFKLKFELIKKELNGPDIYGDFNEFTLICWGSIEGAVREAANRLNESGEKFNVV